MKHLYIIFFSIILLSLGACKENINDDSKNSKSETDWLKVANWIDADSIKFEQIMKFAQEKQLHSKAVSGIEMDIAKLFLGTPYVGKTLEQEGEEALVINFRELDCTTFLENVVALSLCVK